MARTQNPIQQALSAEVKIRQADGTIRSGLTVSEQKGKPRVRYNTPRHKVPETATLPITWSLANCDPILTLMEEITRKMDAGFTLKQAANTSGESVGAGNKTNWLEIFNAYESKQNWSHLSADQFRCWFKRMLAIVRDDANPCYDGNTLMRQYERKHFVKGSKGSAEKRALAFFEKLIDFGIKNNGLDPEWKIDRDVRLSLHVTQNAGSQVENKQVLTPPVQTPDLLQFLDSLEDRYPNIYTMVVLMSHFGLMPAELAVLAKTERGLETFKANKTHELPKHRKPRVLTSIDSLEREGLGDRVVRGWASGMLELPKSVQNAIIRCYDAPYSHAKPNYKAVGDAVRQVLDRNEFWKELKADNPELTPYSFRHSFAWRCHTEYNMDAAKVAPWMGHRVDTHNEFYAGWFDNSSQLKYKEEMIAQAKERRRLASKNDSAKSHEQES